MAIVVAGPSGPLLGALLHEHATAIIIDEQHSAGCVSAWVDGVFLGRGQTQVAHELAYAKRARRRAVGRRLLG